ILFTMPVVDQLYAASAGSGSVGILLRAAVGAICLLPPTILMGATLPAAARGIETTPRGMAWLGFFYAGHICAAVFGCLLAGFILLRVYDMTVATYVAAAINGIVAVIGLTLAALPSTRHGDATPEKSRAVQAPHTWAVYLAIALSGACALGA